MHLLSAKITLKGIFRTLLIGGLLAIPWLLYQLWNSTTGGNDYASGAASMQSSLRLACENYQEKYAKLPNPNGENHDVTIITGSPPDSPDAGSLFMATILGLPSAIDHNPNLLRFFKVQAAMPRDGTLHGDHYGLLIDEKKSTAQLLDPWGNPFFVTLDYDRDGLITCPITNQTISGECILVACLGRDGKAGTPETDADNIYSWSW